MMIAMLRRLLSPVQDHILARLVHFTMGICLIAALIESGVIQRVGDSELASAAVLAFTGVCVMLSLCKTLGHEMMPRGYLRYGSYIMALGYSLYVGGQLMGRVVTHFGGNSVV